MKSRRDACAPSLDFLFAASSDGGMNPGYERLDSGALGEVPALAEPVGGAAVAPTVSRRPWVGIAANSGSGLGGGRRKVERLVVELGCRGLAARVAWTLAERADLVADAARDAHCRCLVAAGGDGTVAALVNERPAVPITVLPTGTENLFARHFGLGRRPEH